MLTVGDSTGLGQPGSILSFFFFFPFFPEYNTPTVLSILEWVKRETKAAEPCLGFLPMSQTTSGLRPALLHPPFVSHSPGLPNSPFAPPQPLAAPLAPSRLLLAPSSACSHLLFRPALRLRSLCPILLGFCGVVSFPGFRLV